MKQIGFVNRSATELSALSEASWALRYEKGATEQWVRVVLACALMLWLPVWLSWCYVVFCRKPDVAGFKVRRQRGFQLWDVHKGDVSCIVWGFSVLEVKKIAYFYFVRCLRSFQI